MNAISLSNDLEFMSILEDTYTLPTSRSVLPLSCQNKYLKSII